MAKLTPEAEHAPNQRWIEYVRPENLPPDENNAKRHEIETIIRSIEKLGVIELQVIDGRTEKLIAGHGRREAFIEMESRWSGDKNESGEPGPLPGGVVLDDEDRWTVPVVHGWSSNDDDHARVALVVLNKANENGGWYPELLADQLDQINASALDLALTGFDEDEYKDLLQESGRLGAQGGAFLDDVADRDAPPPMHGARPPQYDGVELRFAMSPSERDEAVALLRQHQRRLGAETLTATLLGLLRAAVPESS